MKKIVLGMIGLGLISNLFALSTAEIESKIQEIQSLPAQQRVEQMNQLKEQIRNMNAQDREKAILAIKDMQEKMATQTAGMSDKLKSGITQMNQNQAKMQNNLDIQKINMQQNKADMEHEIEQDKADMEHELPEIDHDDTTDNEPSTTKIEK